MKNSKILIGLLFLMIFVSCKTTNVESEKTVSKKSTKYTVIQLSEKSEYLNSLIKYPKFEDYSLLNKVVKNSVENYFNSFNRYAKSDWEELNKVRAIDNIATPPFDYNVSFEVSETKKYISVLLRTYINNGGAHGSTTLISYNFDKAENRLVNIVEATGLSYKDLSKYCNAMIKSRLIKTNSLGSSEKEIEEWVNEGTFPTPDNYEIFMMYDNYVKVFFEEYSVAPYALGEQTVDVPY
ncbi:MAG: DUF4163 domain-containing protein [Treponema sp.]|nr:DUF4163 domain-containing protein [Treponema sp.]